MKTEEVLTQNKGGLEYPAYNARKESELDL
jgi:hypothetical protein